MRESGNRAGATAHCLQKKNEFSKLRKALLKEINHVEISDSNLKNDLTAAAQVLQKKEAFWGTRRLDPNDLNYCSFNRKLMGVSIPEIRGLIGDYAQNIELYAQIMLSFSILEGKRYEFQSIKLSKFKKTIPN